MGQTDKINEELLQEIALLKEKNVTLQSVEGSLRENEQLHRDLFENAPDGILIMTMDGKIVRINKAFAAMHGMTVEEILNGKIQDLNVKREEALKSVGDVMARISAGEVVHLDVEHFHKSGNTIVLGVVSSMIRSGGQSYIMAFHRDMTERRKMEAALQEQMAQVVKMNKYMTDRELRIIEIKKEVNKLCKELGRPEAYSAGMS